MVGINEFRLQGGRIDIEEGRKTIKVLVVLLCQLDSTRFIFARTLNREDAEGGEQVVLGEFGVQHLQGKRRNTLHAGFALLDQARRRVTMASDRDDGVVSQGKELDMRKVFDHHVGATHFHELPLNKHGARVVMVLARTRDLSVTS